METITKPYRIKLQVDNKPLKPGQRLNWVVKTTDEQKSFSFSSGSEWQAMHIWRKHCRSEIVDMYSYTPFGLK